MLFLEEPRSVFGMFPSEQSHPACSKSFLLAWSPLRQFLNITFVFHSLSFPFSNNPTSHPFMLPGHPKIARQSHRHQMWTNDRINLLNPEHEFPIRFLYLSISHLRPRFPLGAPVYASLLILSAKNSLGQHSAGDRVEKTGSDVGKERPKSFNAPKAVNLWKALKLWAAVKL